MDIATHLDAEVAAGLSALPTGAMDFGLLELSDIPAVREAMAKMERPPVPPTTTRHRDETIEGSNGQSAVTVRVYEPPAPASTTRPCLYWIHGGGYMFGSALIDDARIHGWVEQLDCVVVSVEYRLAPEHPFPAPLDDCYAGLAWTHGHAAALGVDPSRIVIGGASAGGGLAAGLALLARDRGEVDIAAQLLIYPMIDDRNVTTSSRLSPPIWNRDANLLGWRAYLGPLSGGDDIPPYAAAARAGELAGLAPAFIGVGTLDVFRDEDIEYALRLLAAGVPTELHVYPGAPHGFEMFAPQAAVSRRFNRDITDWLARSLRRPEAAAS